MARRDSMKDAVAALQGAAGVVAEAAQDAAGAAASAVRDATETAASTLQNVKFPEVKLPSLPSKEKDEDAREEYDGVPVEGALEVIYYLMAADGAIEAPELERFDAIGCELCEDFSKVKERVERTCENVFRTILDEEDRHDILAEGMRASLSRPAQEREACLPPKVLVWDLIAIAYSDHRYDAAERRLIKCVVRSLGIDDADFLELESVFLARFELEDELEWVKSLDRPYREVAPHVAEIEARLGVVDRAAATLATL